MDRASLAPAPAQARFLVEAARARGVLLGTDGVHDNVLKVGPEAGPPARPPPRRVRRFRAACWELTGRGASRTPAPQIKPPLCFSRANADITVSVIDAVLSEMPADPEQLRGVVPLHHEGLRQERALFPTCTVARGGVRKRGGT